MEFVQLILRKKIIKIVATRCQILKLKCTKFHFGWAPPQTPLGELTALPRPLAGFEGPTSKGGEGKGEGREEGREGVEGRGEEAFLAMWPSRLSALIPPLRNSQMTRQLDIVSTTPTMQALRKKGTHIPSNRVTFDLFIP